MTSRPVRSVADVPGLPAALAAKASATPQYPHVAGVIELPSPYELVGQFVHPTIVDAGVGLWNGYRYWLAASAYPFSTRETPCLFCSSDGINFIVPTGLVNPFLPVVGTSALQTDPELCLVGTVMHAWSRQTGGIASAKTEQWYHSTSTDGVSWTAQSLVIDLPTTAGNTIADISAGIVHDGTQFIMFTSHNLSTINRRTSPDGEVWSAPTTATMVGYNGTGLSHIEVIPAQTGTRLFCLASSDSEPNGTMEVASARSVYLGRSDDAGQTFTFAANPILTSANLVSTFVYRTTALHELRDGLDYFRLWYSGMSYSADGANGLWLIGYADGYAPDAAGTTSSITLPGSVNVDGDVTGRHGGFTRMSSRLGMFVRSIVGSLQAQWLKASVVMIDQQPAISVPSPWNADSDSIFTVRSASDRTWAAGSRAGVRFISRASDSTGIAANDYWEIRVLANGTLQMVCFDASAGANVHTTSFNFDGSVTPTGNVTLSSGKKVTAPGLVATGVVDIGPSADGLQGASYPLRVWGDNIRIVTKKTPTGAADASLLPGCLCWDDNYLYVKTAAGAWKRTALTTF